MGTMSHERPSGVEFTENVYPIKLILVGESSVGKTCLVKKFVDPGFESEFVSATVGMQLYEKKFAVKGKNIHITIFDTAGMERFRSLPRSYYRDAHAVMLVYDVTNRASFEKLSSWMEDVDKYGKENTVKLVVGNKADGVDPRQVPHSEGRVYAEDQKALFIETSATAGTGIEAAFEEVVYGALEVKEFWDHQQVPTPRVKPSIRRERQAPQKQGCC